MNGKILKPLETHDPEDLNQIWHAHRRGYFREHQPQVWEWRLQE